MRLIASVVPAALLLAASARGDVGIRVENNRLTTWFEDDTLPPPINWVRPERVFDADLVDLGGIISIDDPGFNAEPGTLANFHLGFDVRAAARVWDPVNNHFNGISPLTMTISRPLAGGITTPLLDPPAPLPGPSVLVPDSPDEFDFHYDNILNGNTFGLYLLQLDITTDMPGVQPSLPYFEVFNYGMTQEQHDAAVQWVRDNMLPAPGSAAVLACASLLGMRRRRRA